MLNKSQRVRPLKKIVICTLNRKIFANNVLGIIISIYKKNNAWLLIHFAELIINPMVDAKLAIIHINSMTVIA